VAYNFQNGNKKIKLLMEYESVTQKVLLRLESILQNAKRLQHVGFEKTLPGFDQQLPAKCSVLPLLFGAEHFQSLKLL
jgi:hypothetical protein